MFTQKFRLYDIYDQRMYNLIKGYMDGVYVVIDVMGEEKHLLESSVEVQNFTGAYDDTTWNMLQHWERQFWGVKGYDEDNWMGKEIYIGDICKCVQDGKAEKDFVVQVEHHICLITPDETIKEIPCDRDKGKLYVIGNISENPLLLTNDELMVERRKIEDRRSKERKRADRRTTAESVVANK